MKMLSRAHVPTIEAGTFPQRPQTAASIASSTTPAIHNPVRGHHDSRLVSAAARLDVPQNPAAPFVSPDHRASLDARPATTVAAMMHPPSHFTTSRKSDAGNQGLQPGEVQPQKSINLFTPRPLVIPAATSQHYSQLLPPRRELPFEKARPSPQSSAPRVLRSATKASGKPKPKPSKPASSTNKAKKAPTRKRVSTASQSAASKRRRSSAKGTKKAFNEAAVAAVDESQVSHSDAGHVERGDTPVPSIEDLLNRDNNVMPHEQARNKNIDTQALLTRAEEVRISGLGMLPTEEVSPPKQPASEHASFSQANLAPVGVHFPSVGRIEVPSSSRALAPFSPAEPVPPLFPCTPANQLINPSTPSAPLAQHTIDTAPQPLPRDALTLFSSITNAYDLLIRHPAFANSDANLAAWTALPPQQRKEAIDTFVCDQYMDKTGGFEALVKVMDGVWQASIVWPELYKNSI